MIDIRWIDNYYLLSTAYDGVGKKSFLFSAGKPLFRSTSPTEFDFISEFGDKFLYFRPNYSTTNLPDDLEHLTFEVVAEGTFYFADNIEDLQSIDNKYFMTDNHNRFIIIPFHRALPARQDLILEKLLAKSEIYFQEYYDGDGYQVFSKKYSFEDLLKVAKTINDKNVGPFIEWKTPLNAYLMIPFLLFITIFALLLKIVLYIPSKLKKRK